jgi:hypothetical protein
VIDSSGVLNKKAAWDSSTNTTFTTYLTNRHITTNITKVGFKTKM